MTAKTHKGHGLLAEKACISGVLCCIESHSPPGADGVQGAEARRTVSCLSGGGRVQSYIDSSARGH